MIAQVYIRGSKRIFDKAYDYIIPEEYISQVSVGSRVVVPFGRGNRFVEAYVVSVSDESKYDLLKEIHDIPKDIPGLTKEMVELCLWMKHNYICSFHEVARAMLPAGSRIRDKKVVHLLNTDIENEYTKVLKSKKGKMGYELFVETIKENPQKVIGELVEKGIIKIVSAFDTDIKTKKIKGVTLAMEPQLVSEDIRTGKLKRIQHEKILEMLLDSKVVSVIEIMQYANVSRSVIATLIKKGYIKYCDYVIERKPEKNVEFKKYEKHELNMEQKNAYLKAEKYINDRQTGKIYLHGVTGSGKTEVYLSIIQKVISEKRKAIVLVPEISLTPQMVDRFKGRFPDNVAVLHSRLSLGERFDQWMAAKEGKVDVMVGARSAIFAPFDDIGAIIIDEEHEDSYKSESTPKYNAIEVAEKRCEYHNAVMIMGSATPSIEKYYECKEDKYEIVKLKNRVLDKSLPLVEIVDMRQELEEGNRKMFSRVLERKISENIKNGHQSIIFINRRGHSSFVLCRSCGLTLKCPNCSVALKYHSKGDRLICHYCGYLSKMPSKCPVCKSVHIRQFGTGTQRVEEEIKKMFPKATLIRMDQDTTGHKNSHRELLEKFKNENINILIGTQMIAKGHDFPNVTLVGILAADSLLNVGGYKSTQRAFQLMTQAAGRAGRGDVSGEVIIQTYNTDHYSIINAAKQDYESFYSQEIKIREALGYPPFMYMARAITSSETDAIAEDSAMIFHKILLSKIQSDKILILGPSKPTISKINNYYRWAIVIKGEDKEEIISLFNKACNRYKGKARLSVDISPVNML